MARFDQAELDAAIRKNLTAKTLTWVKFRAAWPHLSSSTLFYRRRLVEQKLRHARSSRRQQRRIVADVSKRRDPFKLFLELDLNREIAECFAFADQVRAMGLRNNGSIRDLNALDLSMALRIKLVSLSLKANNAVRDARNRYGVWDQECVEIARHMGPAVIGRLPHLRTNALGLEALAALQGLVGALADARALPVGPKANRTALKNSIMARAKAIGGVIRWAYGNLDEWAAHRLVEGLHDLAKTLDDNQICRLVDDAVEKNLPDEVRAEAARERQQLLKNDTMYFIEAGGQLFRGWGRSWPEVIWDSVRARWKLCGLSNPQLNGWGQPVTPAEAERLFPGSSRAKPPAGLLFSTPLGGDEVSLFRPELFDSEPVRVLRQSPDEALRSRQTLRQAIARQR